MACVAALDNEIAVSAEGLNSVVEGSPEHINGLDILGTLHWERYLKTGEMNDLQSAVQYSRHAVKILDSQGNQQGASLSHLSAYLVELFTESVEHDMAIIKEAISMGLRALECFEKDSSPWKSTLNNVAIAWAERGYRSQSLQEVDESIETQKYILSFVQPGGYDRGGLLSRLSTTTSLRYDRTAQVEDLEAAIRMSYDAIEEVSSTLAKDSLYGSLPIMLSTHYKRTGRMDSLNEAIRTSQVLVDDLPDDPVRKSDWLYNHGRFLHEKCQRYKEVDVDESLGALNVALQCGRDALHYMPLGHRSRLRYMNSLGTWLATKLSMTEELGLGEEGLRYLTDAYDLLPPDDPEKSQVLRNQAHIHEIHYQILRKRMSLQEAKAHLSKAISYATEAVNMTKEDSPELCENQKNLAALLLTMIKDFGFDKETYQLAKHHLLAATKATKAPLLVRIPVATQAGLLHWRDEELAEADELLSLAIDLTLQLNPQQMSTEDLRQTLRAVSGVASIATSMALATGKSGTHALQILERAHCIIAGLFVDQKSDISRLRAADPELAQRYDDLRTRLSSLPKEQENSSKFFEMRDLQESLLSELKVVETSVKKLPGFEHFQEVPGEKEFKALARDGPIVAINTSVMRSDAIIVTCNDIKVVPLPELEYSKLDEKLSFLNDSGNVARRNVKPRRHRSREEDVNEVLAWLWKTTVKPILDATELTDSKRIWWITTGLIGRAPLHAAGYHTEGSTENTMSHAISSYVSSFKVLRFSRGRATSSTALDNMLLVSVSSNPPPFQNIDTSLEIKVAEDIFGDALMHLPQAEPGTVLKNIPNYSIAHFACHGFARINDPSSNGLVLVKDGRAVTLTVSDIERVDHKAGAIAYLSACSTAEQSDMKLMDEAIHLANSFQIAGYQHVIGTLWGADDRAAGEVAGSFYRKLLAERGYDNEAGKAPDVAKALHEAIIEYKNSGKGGKSVLEWGPFIHTGT
ncbi:hypothetical protein Hte_010425 [Hypoxylon texense]